VIACAAIRRQIQRSEATTVPLTTMR